MPELKDNKTKTGKKSNKSSKWRNLSLFGIPALSAFIMFGAGIVFWGGFNTAMEATNTLNFCISCHEMENNVYREYTTTVHYKNRTGVRATCSDCHVPDPWVHKFIRKIKASGELFHKVMGSVDTAEKFDAKRLKLAKNVWQTMKSTDSRECRNCHNFLSMAPEFQRPRARKQHLNALKTGLTCIDCHKGIAHKNVRDQLTEEELEVLEKPNLDFVRQVPAFYLESLKRIEAIEAGQKAKQEAAVAGVEARLKAGIEAVLAEERARAAKASSTKAVAPGTQTPPISTGSNINWSSVKPQTITLFYPGQASFEWAQTGKDHGGARAFAKLGDRCASCHANEAREMGARIVSGEKLEPTPIPGKRGHVDVKLQAVHDKEKLYLRFQWPDAAHTPAPFVEGGKMDPENQIKLAMMIAGRNIDKVDRAGCWTTCHHDSRYMAHEPDSALIGKSADKLKSIDVSGGITKYLADSRTKVEIAGRRGKKRGGWNKLKTDEEIAALKNAGSFMDLIRFRSQAAVENGHVLAERAMNDGTGINASGALEAGVWTVELNRSLMADAPGDVSIKPGEIYTVGFALHDDFTSARFHHVSLEFKMGLDNLEAEINVKAIGQAMPAGE